MALDELFRILTNYRNYLILQKSSEHDSATSRFSSMKKKAVAELRCRTFNRNNTYWSRSLNEAEKNHVLNILWRVRLCVFFEHLISDCIDSVFKLCFTSGCGIGKAQISNLTAHFMVSTTFWRRKEQRSRCNSRGDHHILWGVGGEEKADCRAATESDCGVLYTNKTLSR